MKLPKGFPVFCFAAFVFWLLSIVMDGPLLSGIGISHSTTFFLPAHILSLLLIGFLCPYSLFKRWVPASCIISVSLILMFPKAGPAGGRYMLVLLGASGAFMAIAACMSLQRSTAPIASAASGLAIANLLFLPLNIWPGTGFWRFVLVAVPLLSIAAFAKNLPQTGSNKQGAGLGHYLPFILVFQIICGLMYAFIMPAYHELALLPGFELLFYIAAVIAASLIVQSKRDLALVCGVVLGMVSFTFLQLGHTRLPINLSMFTVQAGAGFVDLVLIAVLLAHPNPLKAFGLGLATICTGIIAGKFIGYYFAGMTESIVMVGHVVLNLSILTLYFLGRLHYFPRGRAAQRYTGAALPAVQDAPLPNRPVNTPMPGKSTVLNEDQTAGKLPEHLRLLLSDREYAVLERALEGRTYRETARELEISESTVKTYMYRIYEKMGVKGKKKLFEKLNSLQTSRI